MSEAPKSHINLRDPVTWLLGGAALCYGFALLWGVLYLVAAVFGL